jgi:hypothetical protein
MGTSGTVGFIQHHTCNLQILYPCHYGYSMHRYGYSVGKSYLWYIHAKPYKWVGLRGHSWLISVL